ncbi:MAG: RraA family protein [Ruminiclostridium sp.]|nr:RraA family protein [Ruminiclostridium sp.]
MANLLERLKNISTPIISDAIEKFDVRPRSEGYMDSSIRCIFPENGAMVGYAYTGKIIAELPKIPGERSINIRDLWENVRKSTTPTILVVQDMDQHPKRGCAWGDYIVSIFKSLGCIGTVTNGNVRDVDEVGKMGFHMFASNIVVGHAYIRYVEMGTPVRVGGVVVNPGDLIHADKHGVLVIPDKIPLEELLNVVEKILESERKVIEYCSNTPSPDFDEICRLDNEHGMRKFL